MHIYMHQVVDDPSGNSYVENKLAPEADPQLTVEHYDRSEQQNKQMGIVTASKVSWHVCKMTMLNYNIIVVRVQLATNSCCLLAIRSLSHW